MPRCAAEVSAARLLLRQFFRATRLFCLTPLAQLMKRCALLCYGEALMRHDFSRLRRRLRASDMRFI